MVLDYSNMGAAEREFMGGICLVDGRDPLLPGIELRADGVFFKTVTGKVETIPPAR